MIHSRKERFLPPSLCDQFGHPYSGDLDEKDHVESTFLVREENKTYISEKGEKAGSILKVAKYFSLQRCKICLSNWWLKTESFHVIQNIPQERQLTEDVI